MNTSPLYDIAANYRAALEDLSNRDDLPPELVRDTLDAVQGEVEEKGKAVAAFFQNLDAQVVAMKEAEKRIADRRKSAESKVKRLKDYLLENMQACNIEKIECPEFKVSVRKNPPSVEVFDESLVPKEFMREKVVVEVNKKLIKDFGGCDGARIVTGYRLDIK